MLNLTPQYDADYRQFIEKFSAFTRTQVLDELRQTDFTRLDAHGHIYLDYTGGGLYAESHIRRHADWLIGGVFGNPHSSNPTSKAMTEWVEKTRRHILDFFRADPTEYVAIFTANASGACKIVGESYPFQCSDRYLLTADNHNSILGIREFDCACGAETLYIPMIVPTLRVDEAEVDRFLAMARPDGHNLFAFPAQSNFSGVQYPLEWVERAQQRGWDVFLDAAAYVPTSRLDLSVCKPEFVSMSFYKMFGYPTGVGALIAKRKALEKLQRPWFGGGTITVTSALVNRHYYAPGAAAFEDGTLNYLTLPAVDMGLDFIEQIGIETIHDRVECLAGWLIETLLGLRHANDRPLVFLYGPACVEKRGGTITINLYDAEGKAIDYRDVEAQANAEGISLRTGRFCNPGASETALGLSKAELTECFDESPHSMNADQFRRCFDGKSIGAVRVSVGLATSFADAWRFVEFAKRFLA